MVIMASSIARERLRSQARWRSYDTLAKRLTETFSLYLLPPSLTLDIHVMVNMSKQDIR